MLPAHALRLQKSLYKLGEERFPPRNCTFSNESLKDALYLGVQAVNIATDAALIALPCFVFWKVTR